MLVPRGASQTDDATRWSKCLHTKTFSFQFRNQLMRKSISIEIYGWEWPKLLSISSTNATDIHWRRAKIGHDTDACNVGCTSRRPMRPRDTRHSSYFTIAIALAEIREGKPSVRRGRNNERGNLLNSFYLKNRTIVTWALLVFFSRC